MKKLLQAFKAFFEVLFEKGTPQEVSSPNNDSLIILFLMQKRGRLIDFLMEDIAPFTDEQVGAAVRDVHAQCRAVLKESLDLTPIVKEQEGAVLSFPKDADLSKFQLSGNVKEGVPIRGTLRHKGWEAKKYELPSKQRSDSVLALAEVEV